MDPVDVPMLWVSRFTRSSHNAMYTTADFAPSEPASTALDPIESELQEIESLCQRSLANRELLYCSPSVRHIVESEVPRLVGIIRHLNGASAAPVRPSRARSWAEEILLELRREVSILRDLVERR